MSSENRNFGYRWHGWKLMATWAGLAWLGVAWIVGSIVIVRWLLG